LRGDAQVHFSGEALLALQGYDFPGNVRELENVIERALALCSTGVITVQDLQLSPAERSHPEHSVPGDKYSLPEYLDRIEKQALLEALQQTGFNRTAAAKLLGLTFRTMRYRMERLGIKDPHGSDEPE
jgi:two-component system response regulator PilR (NtrC family)